MNDLLLQMNGIHKHFPGVHALKGVDFEVRKGEVHALVGENGAGKSTLMLILAGVYQPDEGTICFDGRDNNIIRDEQDAQNIGIAIVFQERSLFSLLSVAENIFAGRQPVNRWGTIDYIAMHDQSRALLERLGLDIDPDVPLDRLSFAQQQMVEVAKALSLNARLLILDEPTAALTDVETEAMFAVMRQLREQGVGIIHISHRLEEIFEIADRVTVLKDGEYQGTFKVSDTTPRSLVSRMVGRELLYDVVPRSVSPDRPIALEVRELGDTIRSMDGHTYLKDISFILRSSEIVALAGLEGSGRSDLALSIFGAKPHGKGEILVNGQPRWIRSPQDAIAAGIGYLPSDRKDAGLFLEMSIANNIAAARLDYFGKIVMDDRKRDSVAEQYREKLQIAAPSVKRSVQTLSGGNQQKVVLSKWLLLNPTILIVDEPTCGVDVSVKAEVHRLLRELADQGTSILVISSELPEVLALADRILMMRNGRLIGELPRENATEEAIMQNISIVEEAI